MQPAHCMQTGSFLHKFAPHSEPCCISSLGRAPSCASALCTASAQPVQQLMPLHITTTMKPQPHTPDQAFGPHLPSTYPTASLIPIPPKHHASGRAPHLAASRQPELWPCPQPAARECWGWHGPMRWPDNAHTPELVGAVRAHLHLQPHPLLPARHPPSCSGYLICGSMSLAQTLYGLQKVGTARTGQGRQYSRELSAGATESAHLQQGFHVMTSCPATCSGLHSGPWPGRHLTIQFYLPTCPYPPSARKWGVSRLKTHTLGAAGLPAARQPLSSSWATRLYRSCWDAASTLSRAASAFALKAALRLPAAACRAAATACKTQVGHTYVPDGLLQRLADKAGSECSVS